jgi:hypothetical protein
VLLCADGFYSVDDPRVFNPASAKRKKFPPTGKLLYLSAC